MSVLIYYISPKNNTSQVIYFIVGCTSNCLHCIVDNTCLPNECSPGYVFNSTSLTCEGYKARIFVFVCPYLVT